MATLWESAPFLENPMGANRSGDMPYVVKMPPLDYEGWEEFLRFAESDQVEGYFSWDNCRNDRMYVTIAMFSDPNAAFACKMRFG